MMTRASLISILAAGALAGAANGQVFINEFYYDATGTDGGKAFIEIYGPPGLDISGWQLISVEGSPNLTPGLDCGNANQTGPVTLPPGSFIKPDGYFVVADAEGGVTQVVCDPAHNGGLPDLLAENADMENGPEEAVQLMVGGVVIDALQITGTTPSCTLDVLGQPMGFGTAAGDVFGGFSLERWPAGSNSGNNATDFWIQGRPSPGTSKVPAGLVFSTSTISVGTGGFTNLAANFANGANRPYLVVASVTPPTGFDPLGVPYDAITDIFIQLAVTPNPIVVNFVGTLDASGKATATLSIPAGLVTLPTTIPFYFCGISPVTVNNTKTNVVTINLTP